MNAAEGTSLNATTNGLSSNPEYMPGPAQPSTDVDTLVHEIQTFGGNLANLVRGEGAPLPQFSAHILTRL